jgi:putative membrane protein
MITIAIALVALLALLHVWILVLEMFLWTKPQGRRAFGMNEAQAQATKVLAANQGLYNGFLAAGLLWSLLLGIGGAGKPLAIFFAACVLVAGVYGACTASKKILYVQALPALIALGALLTL